MQRIRNLREIAYINQEYLKEGDYTFAFESKKDFILNKNDKNMEFINNMKRNVNQRPKIRKTVFFSLVNFIFRIKISQASGARFEGDLLMKTRNGDVKIFNFEESLVLTLIQDKKKYKMLKDNYNFFHQYYNIPIVKMNDGKQYFIEKLINFRPYRYWSSGENDLAVKSVYEGISKQSKDMDKEEANYMSTGFLMEQLLDRLKDEAIIEAIGLIIPAEKYKDQWPIIRCHGDLNFNNILIDERDIFFIDWDDVMDCSFIYDFMNCIFVDAMYGDSYYFLDKYMKGGYDEYLVNLFNIWSLTFNPEHRGYYLCVYIAERVLNFELVQNLDKLDLHLGKYKKVLSDFIFCH